MFQIHVCAKVHRFDIPYIFMPISTGSPFEMNHLVENNSYLEHTLQSKSDHLFYDDNPTTRLLSKNQQADVNYITTYTGHIIKDLMQLLGAC